MPTWKRGCAAALVFAATAPLSAQQPCFSGSGGPNGDFDWVVENGETFLFDTTATRIFGGPGGVPVTFEDTVDGVVDVRDLIIEPGGEIRVLGPNPMRILATGRVVIRGRLDLSGFHANDVATLNTGNMVERGGSGAAGGGRGGDANVVTTSSSPRGGRGQGPFGTPDAGGEGGESAYAPATLGKDARRPGGGGGARLAADQGSSADGLAATSGNDGHPSSTGAESRVPPARGGAAGAGPFMDEKPENDFFGVAPIAGANGRILGLIRGEIPDLWAGYGGGGGGNAIPASEFPNPNWSIGSDEKGGAGGGGGGALHVQALGSIVFGAEGEILADAGRGATGENTHFLDHVGGTGGAGSGGHIVLESASEIDFTDGGANTAALPRDWIAALGQPKRTGRLSDVNPCCRTYSNGGAGGPGVLQLHVPRATLPPGTDPARTDIVVPAAVAALRYPLDALSSPRAFQLFPTCDPFPPAPFGWFGAAGRDARLDFLRAALEDAEARTSLDEPDLEAAIERLARDLPRRF